MYLLFSVTAVNPLDGFNRSVSRGVSVTYPIFNLGQFLLISITFSCIFFLIQPYWKGQFWFCIFNFLQISDSLLPKGQAKKTWNTLVCLSSECKVFTDIYHPHGVKVIFSAKMLGLKKQPPSPWANQCWLLLFERHLQLIWFPIGLGWVSGKLCFPVIQLHRFPLNVWNSTNISNR